MPIRKRTAVSNPVAFNEDQAIRIALRAGVAKLQRERVDMLEFEETTDAEVMRAERQLAFLERMLNDGGNLKLVSS